MVVALALGIGLNSAVFTFVNALLLRPPQGVKATNKLVEIWLHNPKSSGRQGYFPFNYPDYAYYRDHTKSLEGLMAFDGDSEDAIWNHEGTGEILHGQFVSGNLFSLLGVNAVVGRTLSVEDDRIDNPRQVVVLSYPFWKQKLGGDVGVIGKTLMLNGAAFTVVGVAPAEFTGLMVGTEPDFWAPLTAIGRFRHDDQRSADETGLVLADCRRQDASRGRPQERTGGDARAGEAGVPGARRQERVWIRWWEQGRLSGCGGVSADDDAGAVPGICGRVYGRAAGGVCAGPPDCVHQRSQPAAGAGDGTGEGDGDTLGAGRRARAPDSADAGGEHDAGGDCGCCGRGDCVDRRRAC